MITVWKNALAFVCVMTLTMTMSVSVLAEDGMSGLTAGTEIADFKVEASYQNESGKTMGARFRHSQSGFVLDVLRIQSVPQAFMWVSTPPPTDQGEPHTLEHLLLGKGTRGRYVASLEDMSLGYSSAYTQQTRTCYHFYTVAGPDVFFNLFEQKLNAMLNPNFSDEEIRREVANMGVIEKSDGSLGLEEKGTVYNEMVSSFERPWGNLYYQLGRLMFGDNHPLSYSAGGFPAAIRTMQPEDIRKFYASTHHLNNMGAVISIGNEITLESCLQQISGIFNRVEPDAKPGDDPATANERLPKYNPAPFGQIQVTGFPHGNENESGLLVYAWPATREMNNNERYLLELFIDNLASGATSNLYRHFIDSKTRTLDIGTNSIFAWVDTDPGIPIMLGMSNVRADMITETMIDSIRAIVLNEISRVAELSADSDELASFNARIRNRIIERRRDLRQFLNQPPRFGYHSVSSRWLDHLQRLADAGGKVRALIPSAEFSFAEQALSESKNIWGDYVARWHLLDQKPYGVGTRPDPQMLKDSERDREQRITMYIDNLKKSYAVATAEEAIAQYKKESETKTEEIEREAASLEMPGFLDNPPLGIDDQLDYRVEPFGNGGSLVVSIFDNISSGTAGFAFQLNVVPESLLMYVPAIPTLLTDIGVVRDGQSVSYDRVTELLRQEILNLDAYFDINYRTERAELILRAAGSDPQEIERALGWIETFLFDADLNTDNIDRLRDAVDLRLKSSRNRMRGSEESWVNTPAKAYWKQQDPLLLAAGNFLTQTYALHRLRSN